MSRIDEFIAHGLLPFVGRRAEMEKILGFWRSTPDAQQLRAQLITAEAGVGKSRLIAEALELIRLEGGAVVHVKLYPEAANSIGMLVARSLRNAPAGQAILKRPPGDSVTEVVEALKRLSRLRPTMLVLEDIHLFPTEAIPDLTALLSMLADETLSLLCLSRPTNPATLGMLEGWLVESMRMEGMSREDLRELWNVLFDAPPSAGTVECLHAVTKGNALAVRSGLRGAIQAGVPAPSGRTGQWKLTGSLKTFEEVLRRSVSLVVEGMVAQLTPEQRRDAAALASLGEVFCREAARALGGSAGETLGALTAMGIVTEISHPVSPLAGIPIRDPKRPFVLPFPTSDYPLSAFTHTLLHGYLAERAESDIRTLLRVIGSGVPFYSLLPFQLIGKAPQPKNLSVDEELLPAVQRISAVVQGLDRTANWPEATAMLSTFERVVEWLADVRDVDRNLLLRWRLQLGHVTLSVTRRRIGSPEWIACFEQQSALTEQASTLDVAYFRLMVISYRYDLYCRNLEEYRASLAWLSEVEELVERFPELGTNVPYVYLLDSITEHAADYGDRDTLREMYVRVRNLIDDPETPFPTRGMAIHRVLKNYMQLLETPEDLQERTDSIPIIDAEIDEADPYYGLSKLRFLVTSGNMEEALDLADRVLSAAFDRGLWLNTTNAFIWRMIAEAALGAPLEYLTEGLGEIAARIGNAGMPNVVALKGAPCLVDIGFLTGKMEEGVELARALFDDRREPFEELQECWYGLAHGRLEPLRAIPLEVMLLRLTIDEEVSRGWKQVIERFDAGADAEETARLIADLLARPVLDIYDILSMQIHIRLQRLIAPDRDALISIPAVEALERALRWLKERSIVGFMPPLIALLHEFGSDAGAEAWEQWRKERGVPQAVSSGDRENPATIRLSMLGTIRAVMPSDDIALIRGVRIRTLLGLMVADRMIAVPLSSGEFQALAGGEESNPEHARKKKNMAVVRLREILGHDAVLTEGATPQLNPDLVDVDLLQVDRLVRTALEAARGGAFVRALPCIEEALDAWGGEVPFPTLYETFFEAAREDFEYRLRQAVIETARGFIDMGDAAGAEPLLRRAVALLPGDEEIGDLLCNALVAVGNRMEAERVRLRMRMEAV